MDSLDQLRCDLAHPAASCLLGDLGAVGGPVLVGVQLVLVLVLHLQGDGLGACARCPAAAGLLSRCRGLGGRFGSEAPRGHLVVFLRG